MKVLHVESGMHLYGGALQVVFLLRGLRARGGEHVLVCPPGSAVGAAAREAGLRVRELPMRGDLDLGLIPRLGRVIRQERPDLVHLHSRRGADLLGGIAARLAGVPAVLSRRVDNPEPRGWVRLKYRLYARVITISEGIRRVLLDEGVPAERVVCVPSAVDTEQYRPGGDRARFRREFGLDEDELVVGMLAQFIERKGHRVLIEAMPAVLARHPRTRFLLFGQGPRREHYQALVEQRGLSGRVLFPGFREDLDELLPCLDVVAHPAFMEGLGVALLQSAACAVPIVACPSGGIPEIVHDGVNGRLVTAGDAAALAQALNALLADPELRRRYGSAGRELAQRSFSIPAMVNGNAGVYAELLGGGQ